MDLEVLDEGDGDRGGVGLVTSGTGNRRSPDSLSLKVLSSLFGGYHIEHAVTSPQISTPSTKVFHNELNYLFFAELKQDYHKRTIA